MTAACTLFLSTSLLLYLGATLLFQGHFLLHRSCWQSWARRCLQLGAGIHGLGVLLHLLMSGQSPFSSMLVVVSLLVIALLVAGLLLEHRTRVRHLGLLLAPLAFLALLYPVLMPVRVSQAESILIRYPWLGVHVAVSLLGLVGFALAFCTAITYLIQSRLLKRGRLTSYLPALDTAASATYHFAGAGFSVFSLGLGMGIVWLFGSPGESLAPGDTKILLAVPTWVMFAGYLYLRGVRGRYGSRLKWLVIVGFLLAVVNLFGVRHHFETEFLPHMDTGSPGPDPDPAP